MITLKTKHPIKVANQIYPKETLVERLSADHPLVQKVFPNMKTNSDSKFIAVRFLDRNHATLGLSKDFCNHADMA